MSKKKSPKVTPLMKQYNRIKAKYPDAVFSQETVPAKAGFIVERDGIDYNYFFDQMVAEIKKDFTPKLASLAFQKDE